MTKQKTKIQLSDHFTYGRLFKFVYPSIIMMVFTSIYGVVDGLFVSNFTGKVPFAAINLVMPFLMLFGGIGFMFGTGGTALTAKTLGEGKKERANQIFSMIIEITFIVGLIISIIGIIFMRPVCILLGAKGEMISYCVVYGRIIMGFMVCFMMQNLFQSFLVTAEKPKLGLAVTIAAGLTNMILDALFVGLFRWGVVGAACATGISQFVGGILPLIYFIAPNSSVLHLRFVRMELRPILQAATNGISEMVSNITGSIVSMVYNHQLLKYAGSEGDGVAAYGTLMYVGFIFVAVFVGYAVGSAPIVSFNYGAGNHDELKNMRRKSIKIMLVMGVCMLALAELLAVPMAKIYVGYDQALMEMTVHCFRITVTTYLIMGFNIFASSFFTALNNGVISAIISFLRTFVFKLSAVFLLPLIFGLDGIWWAEVTAEVCAFVISLALLLGQRRKYDY